MGDGVWLIRTRLEIDTLTDQIRAEDPAQILYLLFLCSTASLSAEEPNAVGIIIFILFIPCLDFGSLCHFFLCSEVNLIDHMQVSFVRIRV